MSGKAEEKKKGVEYVERRRRETSEGVRVSGKGEEEGKRCRG